MMLVNASSTARVMERQSEAEKPNTSVKRSSAPRTTQSSLGSLCSCSFNSTPSLDMGTPSPSGCCEGFTLFMCQWGPQESGRSIISNGEKGKAVWGQGHSGLVRGISTTLKEDHARL